MSYQQDGNSGTSKTVCVSDRQLALRAKWVCLMEIAHPYGALRDENQIKLSFVCISCGRSVFVHNGKHTKKTFHPQNLR